MQLFPHQERAVQSVFDYYKTGNKGNPIIVACTSAGKSVMLAELARRVLTEYEGQRIIMATHVKELIAQNYEKIMTIWPSAPVGIYSAGLGRKQGHRDIVYGGIQSMHKKAHVLGHRNFLFIDECHLLSPKQTGMYMKLIEGLKQINPKLKVIGFTATEWRTKGGSLIDQENAIFTDICFRYDIEDALRDGRISPLVSKSSVIQGNMSAVKMTAGEFNAKQMEAALDKDELTEAALDEISSLASDRQHFLYFCAGIKHCEHVQEALKRRGVNSYIISHNTPAVERDSILEYAKNATERTVLINNAVLTTGTDLPNLDCIVLLRATASSVLYIQMLGRGMRKHPEKQNCLVLDYAGNIERFGAVDLLKAPKKRHSGEVEPGIKPQKICESCRSPVPISSKQCKDCGYIFPEPERPAHQEAATIAPIMASEIKPTRHEVADVKYKSHIGASGVPTLRVMYYDSWGYLTSEFVCFSHTGYARDKALAWAMERGLFGDMPANTEEALAIAPSAFNKPVFLQTKKNGKYLEIVEYEF